MYVMQYQTVTKTRKNGVLFAQCEGRAILSHSQRACESQYVSKIHTFAYYLFFFLKFAISDYWEPELCYFP